MPKAVAVWAADTPPTAKALNLAAYTCDGTGGKPNGILWQALARAFTESHTFENQSLAQAAGPTGSANQLQNGTSTGYGEQICDGGGYFGVSNDGTLYGGSHYWYKAAIPGGAGDGVTPGGWQLICHVCPVLTTTNGQFAGTSVYNQSGTAYISSGCRQHYNTNASLYNTPFYIDLLDTTGVTLLPTADLADSASAQTTIYGNGTNSDQSGNAIRLFAVWMGVDTSNASSYGTYALPTPYSGYTATPTSIGTTSASVVNINDINGVAGPLNFLANPPMFRVGAKLATSISTATATQVSLGSVTTGDVDSYSGWNGTTTYTVQVPGIYLVEGVVCFAANATGQRLAGVNVNGTIYWGPGYQVPTSGTTIATKTQMFSLQPGDTVSLYCYQNSGGALALQNTEVTRLLVTWMGGTDVPAPNAISGDDAHFTASIGTWAPNPTSGNCTVARSTAQAHTGPASLALTSSAAGGMTAIQASGGTSQMLACNAGDVLSVSGWFRAATTGRACNIGVQFWQSNGTYISTVSSSNFTSTTTGWTLATSLNFTAPALAAFVSVWAQVQATAAGGEVHYLGDITIADLTTGGTWTPPDPTYRWQSGTKAAQLPGLFQTHLANDLGFLISRPHLLGYQATAQTGLANGAWAEITLDTIQGIIHGQPADNYNAWNAANHQYAAPVSGWYFYVGEVFTSLPSTTTSCLLDAGVAVATSGGRTPNTAHDIHQSIFPSTANTTPGSTIVGMTYLLKGETINPSVRGQNYTSTTWSTAANATVLGGQTGCHFELIWISE